MDEKQRCSRDSFVLVTLERLKLHYLQQGAIRTIKTRLRYVF